MSPMIFCKSCGAPICYRSKQFGDKIPKKYRGKMKGANIDGVDKRLCAECEEAKKS